MLTDISLLPIFSKTVRIVRINGILVKLSIENFLGDFTQSGGVSALSALFRCGVSYE